MTDDKEDKTFEHQVISLPLNKPKNNLLITSDYFRNTLLKLLNQEMFKLLRVKQFILNLVEISNPFLSQIIR